MLIITSLAAAALAASSAAVVSDSSAPPPVVITVTAVANVTPSLVSRVLDEADAIWHPTGVAFVWRRVPWSAAARLDQNPFNASSGLRIVIGDARGASHEGLLPLGWIQFEHGSPSQEIYLSYRNAIEYMTDAAPVAGAMSRMPPIEKEIKLARAMGRALAHGLGPSLWASRAHTPRGWMGASHTASEFFDFSRRGFEIDVDQRQFIATLWRDGVIASR